jgi:hypothetical protein
MKLQRQWIAPLTMGAFLLSAATGALMFFHLDSGLNKAAQEWLSWALLGGVALRAADDADASVAQRAGGDTRAQIRVLAAVMKAAGG